MSGPTRHLSGTGSKTPTPADKSKFLQTCNRLSLFLKENGNIPHLNLTLNAKSSHTTAPAPAPSADINLPQYFILESSSYQVQNSTNKAATSCSKAVTEPTTATAQMTIFYGGQVLVLDDVSTDRARDLMLMTNKGRHGENIDENHHVELAKKDSDLPIARRASLHKFLAKRKDREPHNHCPGAGGSSSSSSSSGKEHRFDLNM